MIQADNGEQEKSGHDFNKLSGETSLHGIRFIGNRDIATSRRFIWTILVLTSISSLSFTVYKSITKYYEYNVTSSISIKQNTIVNFPAVTFCNYNQFRESLMTDKEKNFFGNFHQNTFNFTPYNEVNFTEMLLKISHKVEDMLLGCNWQYMPCGPENFTKSINDFGVCYTFNGNEKNPLTVTNVGYLSGLRLQIDINQSDYTYSAIDGTGIRMHIHGQDEYPLVYTFGFSVAPGTNTHVSLTGLQVENLKHPYETNCTNKSLKYSKTYTESHCINECKYEYVAEKCGCKHPTMLADVPECRIEDAIRCAYFYESVFFSSDYERTCDCPIACTQTFYKKRLSSASWPTKYRIKKIQEEFNYTLEHIRDSLLKVDVYFEDINFQVIREVPNFSAIQLLSEIGGNMGILCGMSIITVIEFLEFGLIAAILRFCRLDKSNKVKNSSQSN